MKKTTLLLYAGVLECCLIYFLIVILLNPYKNSLRIAAVTVPKIQQRFLLAAFGFGNYFITITRAAG